MTLLPLSNPSPAPRETVYSYLSRLAATWRTDVAALAYDMGAPFKRFLEQDPAAFVALADWAALDPWELEEMLSWTGVRAGNVRMTFRGELFVSRALRNPVMRGCPVCLREDMADHEGPAAAAMVMRGDWQMREIDVCVAHSHPLVQLWKSDNPRQRYDIGIRLREIEEDIFSGVLDQPETPPSAYDLWLDGRLYDGRHETWLKSHPLFAATTFCRLLGQVLLREEQDETSNERRAVHSIGFDVARRGETAIREAFDGIAAASTGHLDQPNKAFGALYTSLNADYLEENGFTTFRRILRECILDHWPVAAGEVLLGDVVTERRLHSLVTAEKEIGVTAQVIEHFLKEAGALRGNDDLPRSRRLFNAQAHVGLLAVIPRLVGPIAMRKAMGATKHELFALEEEGLLIPRTRVSKVKNPWMITDGTALIAELLKHALMVVEDDTDWETLLNARKRTKISLRDQIDAIRQGRLSVGQQDGVPGFHGIVVCKGEVDDFVSKHRTREGAGDMELAGVMSAAEFGRSIGLRDHGNFIALIETGHTPAEQYEHPKTGRPQWRLRADDISAFHDRFVTMPLLSKETGYHRNTLRRLFAAGRVTRFTASGQDFGPVYLRSEAARVLK